MISSVVRTVLVYLAVVVAMRLMGKRQLGELQPAELVTTLLISNVASICIDEPDLPLSASLVPIFLITALEILNSTLVWFCPKYAQLLLGKPVTIIRNGEILQDELAQLRITASDLAEALRGKDIFSPKDVYWGVIEPNGSITAAPMPQDGGEPPMLPLLIDKAVCRGGGARLRVCRRGQRGRSGPLVYERRRAAGGRQLAVGGAACRAPRGGSTGGAGVQTAAACTQNARQARTNALTSGPKPPPRLPQSKKIC